MKQIKSLKFILLIFLFIFTISAMGKTPAGEQQLKRSYLILNLTDLNDLPKANRWLFKDHASDTVNINGPILAGYSTYRALPLPEGADLYGAYNWRMTEHYWREDPFSMEDELNQGTAMSEVWVEGYNEMIGNPVNSEKRADWEEQENKNAHPAAFVFVNRKIDNDFKGYGLTSADGPFFRFVAAIKYPDNVLEKDGEEWFTNSFIPSIIKQDDLLRCFSYKAISPKTSPFIRVVEFWYRDSNAWKKNWVDNTPDTEKPKWAEKNQHFPYLKPYKDIVSIFLEEHAERDFLRDGTEYHFTN